MAVQPVARQTLYALVASGLTLGAGIAPAAAEPSLPSTPHLTGLRSEGTDAYVTFTDFNSIETGFAITLRERDNPDRILVRNAIVPGSPGGDGGGREVTRQVSGIRPGVALCASMFAIRRGTFPPFDDHELSAPSNTVCADPAAAATAADLALENIRGKAEQQWVTVQSQAPAYLVAFRNAGGDASDITVDITTSGVAILGDQGAGVAGWSAAGFNCATRAPSGGETAAMRCAGGKLAKGQAGNPPVIVKFTGPGSGAIHAQISGGADTTNGNNGTALSVRVL